LSTFYTLKCLLNISKYKINLTDLFDNELKCLSKYMYIENENYSDLCIVKRNRYSIIIVNYIYLSAIKRNYLSIIVKRSFYIPNVLLGCCYAIVVLGPPSSSR